MNSKPQGQYQYNTGIAYFYRDSVFLSWAAKHRHTLFLKLRALAWYSMSVCGWSGVSVCGWSGVSVCGWSGVSVCGYSELEPSVVMSPPSKSTSTHSPNYNDTHICYHQLRSHILAGHKSPSLLLSYFSTRQSRKCCNSMSAQL